MGLFSGLRYLPTRGHCEYLLAYRGMSYRASATEYYRSGGMPHLNKNKCVSSTDVTHTNTPECISRYLKLLPIFGSFFSTGFSYAVASTPRHAEQAKCGLRTCGYRHVLIDQHMQYDRDGTQTMQIHCVLVHS